MGDPRTTPAYRHQARPPTHIRLTPGFDKGVATRLLERTRRELDQRWPNVQTAELRLEESWPPYQLPDDATLSRALADAAEEVTGLRPRLKVAGPSNIGKYLATLGIPATAGYGLRHEGLHGTNERIEIASIPTTQAVYHLAIMRLLGA